MHKRLGNEFLYRRCLNQARDAICRAKSRNRATGRKRLVQPAARAGWKRFMAFKYGVQDNVRVVINIGRGSLGLIDLSWTWLQNLGTLHTCRLRLLVGPCR